MTYSWAESPDVGVERDGELGPEEKVVLGNRCSLLRTTPYPHRIVRRKPSGSAGEKVTRAEVGRGMQWGKERPTGSLYHSMQGTMVVFTKDSAV